MSRSCNSLSNVLPEFGYTTQALTGDEVKYLFEFDEMERTGMIDTVDGLFRKFAL